MLLRPPALPHALFPIRSRRIIQSITCCSASPHLHSPARRPVRHFSAARSVRTTHDVGILGGGVTGLASAYYLARELPNASFTIYEASDRIGGWLQSTRVPVKDGSVLFEAGPRTLRPQGNGVLTASLMQELGLAKDAIFTQKSAPAARNRYVYYPDHLVRMPHPAFGLADNLWNLWTEPAFETSLWNTMSEFWKDARDPGLQDESVGNFFSRRLSRSVVDRLLSAVIHGIYAGDVWQLSARSLFPTQWRDEALHGSMSYGLLKSRTEGVEMTTRQVKFLQDMKKFPWEPLLSATLKDNSVFTFKDGMKTLSDALHGKLFETGRVEFRTNSPVKAVTQTEGNSGVEVSLANSNELQSHSHIVSALSPWKLNKIMLSASGTDLIPTIPSVTVMTVNLYFRTPELHEPGFGYLIPMATPFENNPERALGVVFDTAYSPGPSDVDPTHWRLSNMDELQQARDAGSMINVNDFAWYNLPEKPNLQDTVPARGTKVTVMLGGHWWNDWPAYPSESEGVALARGVLERHLGIKEEPEAWRVNLEKDCIPQYTVGHEQRLKQAHNNIWREFRGRLRVAGNWMSGVGVNDCIRSAYDVAKGFSRDGTGLEHVGEAPTLRIKPARPGSKPDDEKQ